MRLYNIEFETQLYAKSSEKKIPNHDWFITLLKTDI